MRTRDRRRTSAVPSERLVWLGPCLTALAIVLAVTTSGCTLRYKIRPDQLPQLSSDTRGFMTPATESDEYRVVRDVYGDRGEIYPGFDARLVYMDGQELELEGPVRAHLGVETLTVSGEGIAPREVALSAIENVYIYQTDPHAAVFVTTLLLGVALVALTVFLIVETG